MSSPFREIGRRRADVGLRRHRRQVGRHRDHGARRVRARARRRDVDDDRHRRGEEALHDPPHRGSQTARRVEDEHHRRVVAVLGAVDLVLDVLLRDRVDVVVEMNGEDARRVVLCENARRGSKRPESERESTKSPQIAAWHRCKDSISGGSKLLPPKDRRSHPGIPVRRICLLAVPILAALAVAPSAFGSSAAHVTTIELRSDGAQLVRNARRGLALHACRRLLARTREGAVPHTRNRRSLERLAAGSSRGRGRP